MKKHYLKVFLMIVVLLSMLFYFGKQIYLLKKHPIVDINSLLSEGSTFPTEWNSGELKVNNIVWEERLTKDVYDKSRLNSTNGAVMRVWFEEGEFYPPRIVQSVYSYKYPLMATFTFWRYHPRIYYKNHWPNLSCKNCNNENSKPKNWDGSLFNADNEIVICGMGNPESCQLWYVWAKYGKYIISFEYYAPNQGLGETVFYQMFSEVDEEFFNLISSQ